MRVIDDLNIAVIGAGGVGGFYGGLLAKGGEEVVFIARGKHLDTLKSLGLVVRSSFGNFSVKTEATDTTRGLKPADLVLLTVKTYDTERALPLLPALCGRDTVVLSLQNGVDSAERVAQVIGREHVVGGLTYVESRIEQPGVIMQTSKFHRIIVGELDGRVTNRLVQVQSSFRKAGIDCEVSTIIRQALWEKFLFLCPFAEVTSITQSSIGEVLEFPATRNLVTKAMEEIVEIALAQGIALESKDINAAIHTAERFQYESRTSMQRDMESNKPSEIDSLTGKVVALGKQHSVPTPLHDLIYACLKIRDLKNSRKSG